jgi:hypothetical protein
MYTHYPVPSEIKVSKELERTSGVKMILYSHAVPATRATDRITGLLIIRQIRSDIKSIAYQKRNASE